MSADNNDNCLDLNLHDDLLLNIHIDFNNSLTFTIQTLNWIKIKNPSKEDLKISKGEPLYHSILSKIIYITVKLNNGWEGFKNVLQINFESIDNNEILSAEINQDLLDFFLVGGSIQCKITEYSIWTKKYKYFGKKEVLANGKCTSIPKNTR